jgi:hypothetical protein
MNDPPWFVLIEDLEQFGPPVGLERVPRVVGLRSDLPADHARLREGGRAIS